MINEEQKETINTKFEIFRKKFIESKNENWVLANNILYEMCKKYPYHDNEHEIVAKIWLIGRSYAAAIERRKNKVDGEDVDSFYYDSVAPLIKSKQIQIDEKIKGLKELPKDVIDIANYKEAFECHAYLIKIFKDLTQMEKRSLASKYLHFHKPESMFIYDSVTKNNITSIVRKNTKDKNVGFNDHDPEYVDFCERVIELRNHIGKTYGYWLSPREIDTFLLNFKKLK